jgi:hypothetical protein
MALNFVACVLIAVDIAFDPFERVHAREVRLETNSHVAVDVIDENSVEFLLPRKDSPEQPPCPRGETSFEAGTCRRLVDDAIESVEPFEL